MNTKLFLGTAAIMAVCALSCTGNGAATEKNKNEKKTWAEEQGLKGEILCVTDTTWYIYKNDSTGMPERWPNFFTSYDLNEYGQPTLITEYSWEERRMHRLKTVWKDKYTKISEEEDNKITYEYEGENIVKEVFTNALGELGFTVLYDYDKLNRVTKETQVFCTEEGTDTTTYIYTYLDDNNSYKKENPDWDEDAKLTIYFDSEGRTIRETDGNYDYTYQYGKNGLLEKETHSYHKTYIKEELDDEIEAAFMADDKQDEDFLKEKTTEDEQNVYHYFGRVTTYEYKFDGKGNWIKKTSWVKHGDNEPKIEEVTTRTIRYKK